jgi:glycosyltransferase involved in cell wall biosynthesis
MTYRIDGDVLRFENIFSRMKERHDLTLVIVNRHGPGAQLEPFTKHFPEVHVLPFQPRQTRSGRIRNFLSLRPGFRIQAHDPGLRQELAQRIASIVSARQIDLIYAWHLEIEEYLPRGGGPPVLVDLCDAMSLLLEEGLRKRWSLGGYLHFLRFRRFERALVRDYATVFVANKDIEYFQHRKACFDIPNGVDGDYFAPRPESEKRGIIAFSGNMGFRPNVEAVEFFYREGFDRLKRRHPEVRWYVVGANPASEIAALSVDPQVVVTGFVDDVREYLAQAQVVICPMVSGSGIKNKVLEAMAMGKAVVSTPLGVSGIDCTDGEHVLIAKTGAELADQVSLLLEDDARRQQLARNARELVERRYSWECTVERYDRVFETLLAASPGRLPGML